MDYNFIKFKPNSAGKGNYKGGLTVLSKQAWILEKNFPIYNKIDIYIDLDNNAIKIIEGNMYTVILAKRGKRGFYNTFYSGSLVKGGLKIGRYKYIGNNTFKLNK